LTLQLELPLCEWTVINDAYKEEANEWTLRNGLGPLHRAELSREDAACMALELGDKLQGTPRSRSWCSATATSSSSHRASLTTCALRP